MPRRAAARTQQREVSPSAQSTSKNLGLEENLTCLRTNWKWAAFSQFFFTFNHLFAMNDVSLNLIEEDLIHGTSIVVPRIMQRLLYTISYDKKLSVDNWQTTLRKQYRKRDPAANPIGPEPRVEEVDQPSSPMSERPFTDGKDDMDTRISEEKQEINPEAATELDEDTETKLQDSTRASTIECGFSLGASVKGTSVQPSEAGSSMVKTLNHDGDGSEQKESKNWLDLPMLTKLDSMHLLIEWQFQSPLRLRQLMRSDDEYASWRIEPIGYDSKKNAYWLIGADRIWLQRSIPKSSRTKTTANAKKSLKRKRGNANAAKNTAKKGTVSANAVPTGPAAKRLRLQEQVVSNEGTGRLRAAKAQAKMRLDAQAKELAEINRQAVVIERSGLRTSSRSTAGGSPRKSQATKPTGIRVSARLRGKDDSEGWQAVPEEWLNDGGQGRPRQAGGKEDEKKAILDAKTGLESDGSEISDLTELTEGSSGKGEDGDKDEDWGERPSSSSENPVSPAKGKGPETSPALVADRELPAAPEDFVEWETVCVTLEEWEHFPERFEKATHYAEKALYRVLVNDVVPVVVEELREVERKQKMSLAVTQRKRSSRLLLRQSEKEEAEAVQRKRREEEERNSRAKRLEARLKKEEAERERRELAREVRRREREEKEQAEKEAPDSVDDSSDRSRGPNNVNVQEFAPQATKTHQQPKQSSRGGRASNKLSKETKSGAKAYSGEDWEVDCEICHRRGINLDNGIPMMSCGICSRWQHIACHDLADERAGRKRRNWDQVEFLCVRCRHASRTPAAQDPDAGSQTQLHNPYVKSAVGNRYMGTNYHPLPGPANGTTPYAHDVHAGRFNAPTRSPLDQPQNSLQVPQQHQPYGVPVSFNHYQSQQRGYTSNMRSPYEAPGFAQPYGYPGAYGHGQYPQYSQVNGGGQPYNQPTSQARWSLNHNAASQASTSNQAMMSHTSYNGGAQSGVGHDGAIYRGPPMTPLMQTSMHWQSPPQIPQGVSPHNTASQPLMPFRQYGASYKPTT